MLDYFAGVDAIVPASRAVLGFEADMRPTAADAHFVDHICLDMALPREPGVACAPTPTRTRTRTHPMRGGLGDLRRAGRQTKRRGRAGEFLSAVTGLLCAGNR